MGLLVFHCSYSMIDWRKNCRENDDKNSAPILKLKLLDVKNEMIY